jgi:hypothetical protein
MSALNWAAFAVAITSLLGTLAVVVRHLVKFYLSELKQNGGTSIKDQVTRLESRLDELFILISKK